MATTVWKDWPPHMEKEIASFLLDNGLMEGYSDGTFRPYEPITEFQAVTVMRRTQLYPDIQLRNFVHFPSSMSFVESNFLPGTVLSAEPWETLTRSRFAIMLYRYGIKRNPTFNASAFNKSGMTNTDLLNAQRLDKMFEAKKVTWQGVTRQPRILGQGHLFVRLSKETKIPMWLALGQCWRESQWFTTGLSIQYNMGWGMKDRNGRWGRVRQQLSSGFTDYITVPESTAAYYKLMSSPAMPYKALIEQGKIQEALNIYAPPYENDPDEHFAIVMTVKGWLEDAGIY